jgi:hypothetical protein
MCGGLVFLARIERIPTPASDARDNFTQGGLPFFVRVTGNLAPVANEFAVRVSKRSPMSGLDSLSGSHIGA